LIAPSRKTFRRAVPLQVPSSPAVRASPAASSYAPACWPGWRPGRAGLSSGPAVGVGVLGGLVLLGLLALLPARQMRQWSRTYRPQFPA
jgi:hypothetical protein